MNNAEAMRAEFEAWAERERFELLRFSDDYLYTETKGAWQGWQAASAGKLSPGGMTDQERSNLIALAHHLHYAAYFFGYEAGKGEQHTETTLAGNKAATALNALLQAIAAISRATGEQDTGGESNG